MKKSAILIVIALFHVTVFAQVPRKMSYQAVIRNSSGALVVNQAIGMKISILQGSATGTVVYSETYSPNPQTNANGLVTVEIGGGTPSAGTFSGINWGAGTYYLKTETDPSGGTSYTITGTSQLLSVPYAMHAKSVESLAAETDPLFSASPAQGITVGNITNWNTAYGWGNHSGLYRPASWVPSWADVTGKPAFATVATSGSYNDLTNRPALFSGAWADITGKPTTLAGYGITDADNSNTNEIQTLSLSGTQLSLSLGGGTVTLPSSGGGDNWGTQVVVTDATLTGNGTTATPLRIADNGVTSIKIANNAISSPKIMDGTIVTADLADNTVSTQKLVDLAVSSGKIQNAAVISTKLANNAVTTDKINSSAVTGTKIAQAGATNGQVIKWNGTSWAPATDETGSGLTLPFSGNATSQDPVFEIINNYYAGSDSPVRVGIKGISGAPYGIGVYGEAVADGGHSRGIYGVAKSSGGIGVFGENLYLSGGCGITGESHGTIGKGVYGYASNYDGENYGVYGKSLSGSGYGVYGVSPKCGVYGTSTDTWGIAVKGEATGAASAGVQGFALNSSGIGVFGKGSAQGVYGEASSSTGKGINGYVTSETGVTYGVYGETASAGGYAGYFKGRFYATGSTSGNTDLFYVTNTGTGRAIHAVAAGNTAIWGNSTSGYAAVDGRNGSGIGVSGHSDSNYGVYGNSTSNNGVHGNTNSGTKYGVYGSNDGGTAICGEGSAKGGHFTGNNYGVYGEATASISSCYGVYGQGSASNTNSYAGYFNGRVTVTGHLSKGSGSFEIDHPLDPANKILRHSFVESPDMMNIYNGNIITDGNGYAVVILPDYFNALNMDYRYQLTVIGEFAQAIIAEKISGNRFMICTDKPNVEVSWQVTGVRTDPYAIENRIVVEEYKSPELQGYYLHPLPYGQPETRSVEYARNLELMSIVE